MVMPILDLCSGSGEWSRPYREAGYDVIQVDVKDGQDVRLLEVLPYPIRGILAAPPCTHLAGSGARWWEEKGTEALIESLSIVDACLRAVVIYRPKWWALENPVGRLNKYLGEPTYRFHPNDYAGYSEDPESNEYTKYTCLWGSFNVPEPLPGKLRNKDYIHIMPPSDERAALRSVTPDGFAKAFMEANP